jgi:hypothetical protein
MKHKTPMVTENSSTVVCSPSAKVMAHSLVSSEYHSFGTANLKIQRLELNEI